MRFWVRAVETWFGNAGIYALSAISGITDVNVVSNSYSIRSTKIGNSAEFRLPAEFYRKHPQFANAGGR